MEEFAKFLISSFPPLIIYGILVLLFPEKVQKWASMLWYSLSKLGSFFSFAHKKAVKLDIQGSLNDYVNHISKDVPQMKKMKVKVEYVDEHTSRKSFLADDQAILRLRKNDTKDCNFVHGAYLYVSTSLLYHVKRYVSRAQRDSIDLYVTTKLLEKEKPNIVAHFLDEYLHPSLMEKNLKKPFTIISYLTLMKVDCFILCYWKN